MDWFKTVNNFYKGGQYDKDDVKVFVEKGKITLEQYQQITDEEYTA